MIFDTLNLARKGYEAYFRSTDGKNYRGNVMPAFDELPLRIVMAWCAAALAIALAGVVEERPILSRNEFAALVFGFGLGAMCAVVLAVIAMGIR